MKIYTKEWLEKEDKITEELIEKSEQYRQLSQQTGVSEEIRRKIHLHDSVVEGLVLNGDTLIISFYENESVSCVTRIRFTKVQLQAADSIRNGDWWLYEEVYASADTYEIHILFCDAEGHSKELVFSFDEAFLQSTQTQGDVLLR